MPPSETGKTCKVCGRNTPYTDWGLCEACVVGRYTVCDPGAREEQAGLTADEARELEDHDASA